MDVLGLDVEALDLDAARTAEDVDQAVSEFAAGRYRQMTSDAVKRRRPFWRYRHGGSQEPREQHVTAPPKGFNGLVLRGDDPWWETHYPPNGWGCSCYVETLSQADLDRKGLKVGKAPKVETYEHVDRQTGEVFDVPKGIDFGWDYAPGRSWVHSFTPSYTDSWPTGAETIPVAPVFGSGPVAAPDPRTLPADYLLPDDLDDDAYRQAFFSELGADEEGTVVFDVMEEPLPVSSALFQARDGVSKIRKQGRHVFMRLLARTLLEPDEVWVRLEPIPDPVRRYRLVRRYLAWWKVAGSDAPALVSFEWSRYLWTGLTTFQSNLRYIERQRVGVRLYRRP